MSNKENTPLSTMLGSGDFIEIKGKKYKIKPIALKDIEAFVGSNINLGPQLFNLVDKKAKENINNLLVKYCYDENDNPVSLDIASEHEWDVVDLKTFVKKLCDISG